MKTNIIVAAIIATLSFSSCSELMNTSPNSEIASGTILNDVDGLNVAINGIYASMYRRIDWMQYNNHQCFGYMAINLAAELGGEDMVQIAQGPGWFWYDYTYENNNRYSSTIWRCYFTWSYFYEMINNANLILSSIGTANGTEAELNNIYGQAYAVRAYCYFMLIQTFQQTYVGHETLPGVPLYTKPNTSNSEYKGRGTVEEVYAQINADLDEAISLLEFSGIAQEHKSHLDFYATALLKARVALVQNNWDDAITYANIAKEKPNCTLLSRAEATVVKGIYNGDSYKTGSTPFNSLSSSSVMWGAEIESSQSTAYGSFFSIMDACTDIYYAAETPKCISNWLYAQIPESDVRKGWWNGNIGQPASTWSRGANINYNQHKFQWKNQANYTGDYIYMRLEEAYLIEAEAECRLGNDEKAKEILVEFGENRDTNFKANRLLQNKSGNTQTFASVGDLNNGSLLDEILFQRRVELWGETGRIYDIRRLGQDGWTRYWNVEGEVSNHIDYLMKYPEYLSFPADFYDSILLIPQSELDLNPYINQDDQNPIK